MEPNVHDVIELLQIII